MLVFFKAISKVLKIFKQLWLRTSRDIALFIKRIFLKERLAAILSRGFLSSHKKTDVFQEIYELCILDKRFNWARRFLEIRSLCLILRELRVIWYMFASCCVIHETFLTIFHHWFLPPWRIHLSWWRFYKMMILSEWDVLIINFGSLFIFIMDQFLTVMSVYLFLNSRIIIPMGLIFVLLEACLLDLAMIDIRTGWAFIEAMRTHKRPRIVSVVLLDNLNDLVAPSSPLHTWLCHYTAPTIVGTIRAPSIVKSALNWGIIGIGSSTTILFKAESWSPLLCLISLSVQIALISKTLLTAFASHTWAMSMQMRVVIVLVAVSGRFSFWKWKRLFNYNSSFWQFSILGWACFSLIALLNSSISHLRSIESLKGLA